MSDEIPCASIRISGSLALRHAKVEGDDTIPQSLRAQHARASRQGFVTDILERDARNDDGIRVFVEPIVEEELPDRLVRDFFDGDRPRPIQPGEVRRRNMVLVEVSLEQPVCRGSEGSRARLESGRLVMPGLVWIGRSVRFDAVADAPS